MTLAALTSLASLQLIAQSERPSLREMAIEHGGGTAMIESCGPKPSLADVTRRADLIVEAIVRTRASHLTDDERDIFTDYDVAIRDVLFQRGTLSAPRPGAVMPTVFKSHGGHVVLDGINVGVEVRSNDARVVLSPGEHAFLFAKRDPHDGKWLINPYDVFKVVDGAVVPPDAFSDVPTSIPSGLFVQRIDQLQPVVTFRP